MKSMKLNQSHASLSHINHFKNNSINNANIEKYFTEYCSESASLKSAQDLMEQIQEKLTWYEMGWSNCSWNKFQKT